MTSAIRASVLAALVSLAGATAGSAQVPTILVWGDSLSAGYGVDPGAGWVSLLDARLKEQGRAWRVINGSVSGETTAGGLARLPAELARDHPQWVLLELGANDGLRGTPIAQMQKNLDAMIRLCAEQGARTVLFDMRLPPNFGPAYGEPFHAAFATVAHTQQVPLVPFWLGGIATDPDLFQADGLHPNTRAQPRLLEAAWSTLEPLLGRAGGASAPIRHP